MGARLGMIKNGLRTQLWPLPLIGIVVGLAVGILLPELDKRVDDTLSAEFRGYLFGGGSDAARTLLGAVVGSLITVTSLTFSLTVVTLQLASSQFSPRLLRTFTRDRFVHVTLALFLGTFTYALAVLRTVRNGGGDQEQFVPQIAVTLAFLMCLASVVGLVVFLAHLARQIRVETMLVEVREDAQASVSGILPELEEVDDPRSRPPDPPAGALPLPAAASGFITSVDREALVKAAAEAEAVVVLDDWPGSSVVEDVPVGVGWSASGALDDEAAERLREGVAGAVSISNERTEVQDVGYGLRQLTDVCVKALSPGINDPTTAIHALGHISALLCTLAARDLAPQQLRDDDGTLRALLRRPGFGALVEGAVGPARRYGATDPDVLARILALLRELAWSTREPERLAAVGAELERLRATAADQDFDAADRARLDGLAQLVEQARLGRWPLS